MSRYRIYLASAMCIAAIIAATMLWINSARYYPQVGVTLPDQSTMMFIDTPWTNQKKCQDQNRKIIDALRKNCNQCKITDSCATQMNPSWQKALAGQAINDYIVHSGSLRIIVSAGHASKQTCIVLADQINLDKKQTARCVSPQ